MPIGRQEAEEILYREARLVDQEKFEEWLAFFTSDARYWVPANRYDIDPLREVSIIYDDRQRMEERVWRIQSGVAWAQEPLSRTRRLVSNVEVLEASDDAAVVTSNVALFELRRGCQSAYVGRCEHHLRRENGSWKIALKKVELLNNNEPIDNLTFIV